MYLALAVESRGWTPLIWESRDEIIWRGDSMASLWHADDHAILRRARDSRNHFAVGFRNFSLGHVEGRIDLVLPQHRLDGEWNVDVDCNLIVGASILSKAIQYS